MKIIGLTGGVGMGKSTVDGMLRSQGMPVIDTDSLARQIVLPGQPALAEIVSAFGREVLDDTGALRRDVVARLVFGNAQARSRLESILHPRIRKLWREQMLAWRTEGRAAAVVVIPLLFETGAQADCDRTVCVGCTPASQKQRLMARGWSEEEILKRIDSQMPIAEKIRLADYIIWAEGDLASSEEQLRLILQKVLS